MRLSTPLLVGAFWLVSVGLLYSLYRVPPIPQITSAQFLASDSPELPVAEDPGWQPVDLPHAWDPRGAERGLRYGWYRLPLSPPDPTLATGSGSAILLWQVSMNARAYLDRQWIGDGGRMRAPIARNEYRPLLFTLNPEIFDGTSASGAYELLVLVGSAPPGVGLLGPVMVGPVSELRPYFRLRHFLKVGFLQFGAVFILALCLPLCLIGYWQRKDPAYAWFAAFGVLIGINTGVFAARDLGLPIAAREWLLAVTLNGALVAITLGALRILQVVRPRLEWAILLAAMAGALILAAIGWWAPDALPLFARGIWLPASCLLTVPPIYLGVRACLREPDQPIYWFALVGALMLALGVHDLLVINRLISPEHGYWSHYVAPLGFVIFSVMMAQRFNDVIGETEELNRTLAQRVSEKQRQIEAQHVLLLEEQQLRVLTGERERILRDMHDGVGGTLISTLARMESDGVSESPAAHSVRRALDDLRLMLYSLEPSARSLRVAMSILRDRLGALADDTGLALHWDLRHLPDDFRLERRETLQLMRIVQEAFTNVIKHARAQRFSLTLSLPDSGSPLEMLLEDDGVGFAAPPPGVTPASGGIGVRNIRERARTLGARLEFEDAQPGTRLRLTLPVA